MAYTPRHGSRRLGNRHHHPAGRDRRPREEGAGEARARGASQRERGRRTARADSLSAGKSHGPRADAGATARGRRDRAAARRRSPARCAGDPRSSADGAAWRRTAGPRRHDGPRHRGGPCGRGGARGTRGPRGGAGSGGGIAAQPVRGQHPAWSGPQPSKDRFSVKGKAGQAGPRPPAPPGAEREEYAALQSTKRVRESLEKVRAAERRVGGGRVSATPGPAAGGPQGTPSPRASSLRKLLASPERIREGIVLSELLGPPRSMRPFGSA